MSAITVEITATRGSVPRDTGTVMTVTGQDITGTIGGGALEHRAIRTARRMLNEGTAQHSETIPLGPGIGQCCGGAVSLRYRSGTAHIETPSLPELDLNALPDQPLGPVWLWGAGHVGRAVVARLSPISACTITWIDATADRFPDAIPTGVEPVIAADMARLAAHAPRDAHHLIFTYAHDIDLALCAALLRRGFATCGLIGSATKWARFTSRLTAMGLDPSPIRCPIGDPALGKHPDQIALGVALQLLHPDKCIAQKEERRA